MNVLSLFDGISGARQALHNLGIENVNYFASEIDKNAIKISKMNWPQAVQLGNVIDIDESTLPTIDLLIGGSPCTDLSIAKRNREGLAGSESSLFYKYVDIKESVNPKYFLLENVASMSAANRDAISEVLGVEPVLINSKHFTAQLRSRYYWTNIPVDPNFPNSAPKLNDILESGWTEREKSYCVTATYGRACTADYFEHQQRQMIWSLGQPRMPISVMDKKLLSRTAKPYMRKLTPVECERLQGLPCRRLKVNIEWSRDEAKNFVNAVNRNLKTLKFVGNVEKTKLQEFAYIVETNIQQKHLRTKSIVQKNVDTQIQTQISERNLQVLIEFLLNVNNADKNVKFLLPKLEENFVQENASMHSTLEKITQIGREELHQNDNLYIRQMNGSNALHLSGTEMMQNGYTECGGVSKTQRYKCIGNGFTVPVISWILKNLRDEYA
jgi:site-specific DNA-cytosine methylase